MLLNYILAIIVLAIILAAVSKGRWYKQSLAISGAGLLVIGIAYGIAALASAHSGSCLAESSARACARSRLPETLLILWGTFLSFIVAVAALITACIGAPKADAEAPDSVSMSSVSAQSTQAASPTAGSVSSVQSKLPLLLVGKIFLALGPICFIAQAIALSYMRYHWWSIYLSSVLPLLFVVAGVALLGIGQYSATKSRQKAIAYSLRQGLLFVAGGAALYAVIYVALIIWIFLHVGFG